MGQPVLVVEDDAHLLKVIEVILKDCGYRTVSAADGREALLKAAEEPLGAILLDMGMPVMDGWEFAQIFRRRFGNHTPIILLTGVPNAEQRAATLKVDACLDKPFEVEELVSVVGRHYNPAP